MKSGDIESKWQEIVREMKTGPNGSTLTIGTVVGGGLTYKKRIEVNGKSIPENLHDGMQDQVLVAQLVMRIEQAVEEKEVVLVSKTPARQRYTLAE